MNKLDVPDEELACREALRIANIGFERARFLGEVDDTVEALERTIRDRVRRLAGRILIPLEDADADAALWFQLDRSASSV